MKSIPFLLILFIVGCSTTGGLRKSEPTKVKVFEGNYKQLAICVLDKFDENTQFTHNIRFNDSVKTAKIFVTNPASFNTLCEFSFQQDGVNRVVVESRGMVTLTGRGGWPNYYWPFTSGCSKEIKDHNQASNTNKSFQSIKYKRSEIKEILEIGKTSSSEIKNIFGNPSENEVSSNGFEYWGYYYAQQTEKLILKFNMDGLLIDYCRMSL